MNPSASRAKRVRVLIADDHVVVAEGLAFALAPYFTVVGIVHELDRILNTISSTRPDVLLLDLSFGGRSSLSLLREIAGGTEPNVRVVVLTAHESGTLLRSAREAGALTVLLKGVGTQELRLALEAAAVGRGFVPQGLRAAGVRTVRGRRREIDGASLTDRQLQILLLLSEGMSRASISHELGITVKGVDFILRQVKDMTGLEELAQLVAWGVEHRGSLRALILGGAEEGGAS